MREKKKINIAFWESLGKSTATITIILAVIGGLASTGTKYAFDFLGYSFEGGTNTTGTSSEISENTDELMDQISGVKTDAEKLFILVENNIRESQVNLERKKVQLEELQKQHKILELTPQQLEVIKSYNESVSNNRLPFKEWTKIPATRYTFGITFFVSGFFFLIGILFQKRRT